MKIYYNIVLDRIQMEVQTLQHNSTVVHKAKFSLRTLTVRNITKEKFRLRIPTIQKVTNGSSDSAPGTVQKTLHRKMKTKL